MKINLQLIGKIIISIVCLLLLTFVIKGEIDNNSIRYQSGYDKKIGGPFESSGSTSRYALTQAIIENGTLFFNESQSRFAAPDVAEYDGNYFSIFTPGMSFLGIPFYLIGKMFGIPQLFTYFINILFAILNLFLVEKLLRRIGKGFYISFISGMLFIFATNMLPYAGSYTQHLASTALIILALLNALEERSISNNLWLGVLVGIGILVDVPNILLMFPIIIYVLLKHFTVSKYIQKFDISIKLIIFVILIGLTPLILLFGWYNYRTSNSYLKPAQFIGRSYVYAPQDAVSINTGNKGERYTFRLPFRTRNQLISFYTLLLSDERGIFYYSPILVFGVIGFYILYKEKKNRYFAILLISISLIDLMVYSMFNDYYGGWAFGSRYMIPAEAMLCIGIGSFLEKYSQTIIINSIFLISIFYSIYVNTLGAMTTTLIPPKAEALSLPLPVTYTYYYNLSLVKNGDINSLIYNLYFTDRITPYKFVLLYSGIVAFIIIVMYAVYIYKIKNMFIKNPDI